MLKADRLQPCASENQASACDHARVKIKRAPATLWGFISPFFVDNAALCLYLKHLAGSQK